MESSPTLSNSIQFGLSVEGILGDLVDGNLPGAAYEALKLVF
jgi:hypothetical protein